MAFFLSIAALALSVVAIACAVISTRGIRKLEWKDTAEKINWTTGPTPAEVNMIIRDMMGRVAQRADDDR